MLRIGADNPDLASTADQTAFVTDLLDRRAHFHISYL
jgi:hypothetical protein